MRSYVGASSSPPHDVIDDSAPQRSGTELDELLSQYALVFTELLPAAAKTR